MFSPVPQIALTLRAADGLTTAEIATGARRLARIGTAGRLVAKHHRLEAVRAHLHKLTGDLAAARRTMILPERRYLETRAAQLNDALE